MGYDVWEVNEIARQYISWGWSVVPCPPRTSGPREPGYYDLRITADQVDDYFYPGINIAVLTGAPSGGLIDIDLDCREAVLLALNFLPPTGAVFGRRGEPRHWLYYATDNPPAPSVGRHGANAHGQFPMIVEYRADKRVSMLPPSIYSDGDVSAWCDMGGRWPITRINSAELLACVDRLWFAACAYGGITPDIPLPPQPYNAAHHLRGRRGLVRDDEFREERARRYIAKCSPQISNDGSSAAIRVAGHLVRGFMLARPTAFKLLREWCQARHMRRSDDRIIAWLKDAEAYEQGAWGYLFDDDAEQRPVSVGVILPAAAEGGAR